MLIGLISDSHDNLPQLRKAVAQCNVAAADLVLHAGDIISPFCARELKELKSRMVAVFGNNDGERCLWRRAVEGWGEVHEEYYEAELAGQKLLLMHEPDHLEALAASQMYDVIVYGHTHKIDERRVGKTLIVNPGECGAWLTGKSTMALLRLPEKAVRQIEL